MGKRGECIRFKFSAVLFTSFNNKMREYIVEFNQWYQLSIVLASLLHSFGPSLKVVKSALFFLRYIFFYKCANVSIVKFSVNVGFSFGLFCCSFQLFQFEFAQRVCSVCKWFLKMITTKKFVKEWKRAIVVHFGFCVSKKRKALPKAGQTRWLQGITESLVGITVQYRPAFVTLHGKFTSQSYNNKSLIRWFSA